MRFSTSQSTIMSSRVNTIQDSETQDSEVRINNGLLLKYKSTSNKNRYWIGVYQLFFSPYPDSLAQHLLDPNPNLDTENGSQLEPNPNIIQIPEISRSKKLPRLKLTKVFFDLDCKFIKSSDAGALMLRWVSSELLSWSVTVVWNETYKYETLFSLLRVKVNCKINHCTP